MSCRMPFVSFSFACCGLPLLFPPVAPAQAPAPWKQYASPDEAGFAADRLAGAREFAEKQKSAAIFVVYRGHVVVAWGDVSRPFETYSVRKSLMSALAGIHVGLENLDLKKTVGELGIDDVPPLTAEEKTAKVVDLLTSRSGVYHPAAKEPADMKEERPPRGSHAPGTHFWYNNWDFNTIGIIVQRAAGRPIADEFKSRIADPIGMEDFRPQDAYEQLEPSNSIHPAYGFKLSARDLARFGTLYLNNGSMAGLEIVPAEWVKKSTQAHSTVQNGGYGYMWWVWPKGGFGHDSALVELNKYDKFSATGTGGQFLLVVPDAEFVFVHRADTENGRHVRGPGVWKLAEMILAAKTGPLSEEPKLIDLTPNPFGNELPPPPERKSVPMEPAKLDEFVGEYVKAPQFRVTVFKFDDRLFGTLHGQGEGELLAEGADRFFVRNENVSIAFEREPAGRVVRAVMEFQGQRHVLDRANNSK